MVRFDWRIDYITTHKDDEHRRHYISTLGERYDSCVKVADRIVAELKQMAAAAADELKDLIVFFEYVDELGKTTPVQPPHGPAVTQSPAQIVLDGDGLRLQ